MEDVVEIYLLVVVLWVWCVWISLNLKLFYSSKKSYRIKKQHTPPLALERTRFGSKG